MKILYVITTLGLGGVQEHLRLVTKYLISQGHDIWIAHGLPEDKAEAFRNLGAKLIRVPLVKEIRPSKDLSAFFALYRLIRRERFDLVHVHMTKAGILGRFAAKLARVKTVFMTGHGWSGHLENYFDHPLAKKFFFIIEKIWGQFFTDGIILLTREDLMAIRNKKMYDPRKLHLVSNGIDFQELEHFKTSPIRQELGIPTSAPLVLTVGRICKVKAQKIFVDAAQRVLAKGVDSYFLLVGEGPDRNEILSMVERYGLKNRFYLLGNRRDVPGILKSADIFVLTSITEGMAMTLLEAMALGRPVIVSDIPGNRALVQEGRTGLLFPVNNSEILSHRLVELLQNKELQKRLGREAKKLITSQFDYTKMGEQTCRVYEKVMAKRKGHFDGKGELCIVEKGNVLKEKKPWRENKVLH